MCYEDVPNEYINQISPENKKMSTSVYKSVTNASSSIIVSNLKDNVSSDSISVQNQVEGHKLLSSPVLVKKRSKPRKTVALRNHFNLEDSKKNNACIPMKENIFSLSNDSFEGTSKIPMEPKINKYLLNDNNKDVKECKPTSKEYRKLGISQLYNVDTTLLPSGKILKQSKLVFFPNEQSTYNTTHTKHKELNSHISPASKENIKEEPKNLCQTESVDEEVVKGSPTKYPQSNLKVKCLKLKKPSSRKLSEKNGRRRKDTFDRINIDKPDDIKLPLIKDNQVSFNQHTSSVYISAQKGEPCLITKSKTVDFSHEETVGSDSNILNCLLPPVISNIEHLSAKEHLSTSIKKTKQLEMIKNDNLTQKRKFSDTDTQIHNYNSSMYDDETFCLLGENLKKQSISDISELKETKVKVFKSNTLLNSPPAKKCLMDSFDM